MNYDDYKRREAAIVALSDDEVRTHAKRVAAHGEASFPPGAFLATFGPTIESLAGVAETGRFARFLRAEGYEIHLKLFPDGGQGCEIRRIQNHQS